MPSSRSSSFALGVLLLSLLHLSYGAPNPGFEPLHLPLTMRQNARTAEDYALLADNLRVKYGRETVSIASRLTRRGNSSNIVTTNQDADSSYFAPLTVGTP